MITLYKQIHPCQCQSLFQLGFKSLINLRFDGEIEGQPTTDDICQSATSAGLSYHHLPVDNDHLHRETVAQFAHILQNTPKPVMVFCGTGNRAKRLYQCAVVSDLL